jgi:hypothetical protein
MQEPPSPGADLRRKSAHFDVGDAEAAPLLGEAKQQRLIALPRCWLRRARPTGPIMKAAVTGRDAGASTHGFHAR